jgi:hypothetical protein
MGDDTIERLERAIKVLAREMLRFPDLADRVLPNLKRLEAERDRLLQEGDALECAKRALAAQDKTDPNQP